MDRSTFRKIYIGRDRATDHTTGYAEEFISPRSRPRSGGATTQRSVRAQESRRTNPPWSVRRRNPSWTSASRTTSHILPSRPHRRWTWSRVNNSPGTSRNSPR